MGEIDDKLGIYGQIVMLIGLVCRNQNMHIVVITGKQQEHFAI